VVGPLAAYVGGASLYLALVLVPAGALKCRDLRSFEAHLRHLLPGPASRWPPAGPSLLARSVPVLELGLGGALLVCSGTAAGSVGVCAALVSAGFLAANVAAFRKRLPCGCSGVARSPADAADVVRALVFALLAAGVASARARVSADVSDLVAASPAPVVVAASLLTMTALLCKLVRRMGRRRPAAFTADEVSVMRDESGRRDGGGMLTAVTSLRPMAPAVTHGPQ
jgi:uncharacterized membrane protein YphA (DoxX/SURF4 family)